MMETKMCISRFIQILMLIINIPSSDLTNGYQNSPENKRDSQYIFKWEIIVSVKLPSCSSVDTKPWGTLKFSLIVACSFPYFAGIRFFCISIMKSILVPGCGANDIWLWWLERKVVTIAAGDRRHYKALLLTSAPRLLYSPIDAKRDFFLEGKNPVCVQASHKKSRTLNVKIRFRHIWRLWYSLRYFVFLWRLLIKSYPVCMFHQTTNDCMNCDSINWLNMQNGSVDIAGKVHWKDFYSILRQTFYFSAGGTLAP